jgi:AcrR family transcriptional regulator
MPRLLAQHVMASTAGEHDAVRDHILDAANRVIVRDGLAEASTRAIAEEASVASGTLYNYFEDRLHLVAESMLRRARVLSGPLHELPSRAGSGTVAVNLRRFAKELGDMLDKLVPLFAAAFSDTELLHAIRRTMSSGHASSGPFAVHPIEAYLSAEQALGRVAADADCSAAASLVLSLCHERAFLNYFFGKAGKRTSIASEIGFIARSISPSTGGVGALQDPRKEG